jgi:hypothetical protein
MKMMAICTCETGFSRALVVIPAYAGIHLRIEIGHDDGIRCVHVGLDSPPARK